MSTPLSPICDKPLELETSKTDEYGGAVHEHCYIQQLPASRIESTDPQHPKQKFKLGITDLSNRLANCAFAA